MGLLTYDLESTSPIPPARLFNACLDVDNLVPKLLPQSVASVQILKGDGGPGTIKLITMGEASQLIKSVTQRVDVLDKENFTYGYSIIEGGALTGGVESISIEVKIVASPDGGSICKNSGKYVVKDDSDITVEKIKAGKERASGIFKAIETYLLANPDAYC